MRGPAEALSFHVARTGMINWLKNYWLLYDEVICRQLQVVPESLVLTGHGRIWLHNWKGLPQIWLRFKKKRLPAGIPYVRVRTSYQGNYHWLLENMPKLLEARRTIPAFALLRPNSYTAAFYANTLRRLGITAVEHLQPQTMYQVPQLVLLLASEVHGSYSAQAMCEVKDVLRAATGANRRGANPATRLYISQRKAARRKVLNEPAVERLRRRYGFQSLYFEDITFEEQVHLCTDANVLVSTYGAGLSNMIFMPEHVGVIEFCKFDDGRNYFFTQLAATLAHQYQLLYCAAADEQQLVQDAGLHVDTKVLEAMLKQLPA